VIVMSDEPIVFWGPGSEWFWIMAQFVVVAATLIGIYYQFRLQRAANAFEQLNRITAEWDAEPMLRARLASARAVVAGEPVPEGALSFVGNHWEQVASLVRGGHVDHRVFDETFGGTAAMWWAALLGSVGTLREDRRDPTIFENFEWLAEKSRTFGERAGAPRRYAQAELQRIYETAIPGMVERITMAEESRMVPERPPARAATSAGSRAKRARASQP
jgi:hypothetical protein